MDGADWGESDSTAVLVMAGKGIDPVTDSHMRPRREHLLRSGAYNGGEHGAGTNAGATNGRSTTGDAGGVGILERPANSPQGSDFTPEPQITAHDLRTALGEDTDALLDEADLDVDELIRLINAETTMLPAIRLPEETGDAEHEQEVAVAADSEKTLGVLAADVKTWKKRFLKGAALSVLLTLTGGGAAALAMDKNVTVDVDGHERTVHSFGGTVGEVLDDAGIEIGQHDALSPSPQADVGDGAVIHLERGRQLNLVVDGVERPAWVRAVTVGGALEQLGMSDLVEEQDAKLSTTAGQHIPLDGMSVQLNTLKHITLFDGGHEPKQLTTHALTAGDLVDELDLDIGSDDKVVEGLDNDLTDNAEIHITRTGVTVKKEKESIDPPVKEVDDSDMEKGKKSVKEKGTDGEKLVSYKVKLRNGEEVARHETSSKVLEKPEPKVVHVGTKEPEVSDGAVWDELAECEAGGDWQTNSGNGFYGGLQFDEGTWSSYGGTDYAELPHEASRAQQIEIATKVRDSRGGYGAWPACSSELGLS